MSQKTKEEVGKLWVLTGYSHKMDGLILVVEAPTEAEAMEAGAKAAGGKLITFEHEGHTQQGITCDAQVDAAEMTADMENGEPGYWWTIEIQELTVGRNLAKAVQW
jgi:hypothetical protein